jgi:hypothetical protein
MRGKSDMRLRKTLAIVVCAGLLSATAIVSPRHAYAQDAAQSDLGQGSWGSASIGTEEDSSPEAKAVEEIGGCWSGKVHDLFDGAGDAFFFFDQNGTVLETDSEFQFQWPDHSFAQAGMIVKGSVSSKGFKMTSPNLPPGKCNATISGSLRNGVLKGRVQFHEQCAKGFKDVTFSVKPEACL